MTDHPFQAYLTLGTRELVYFALHNATSQVLQLCDFHDSEEPFAADFSHGCLPGTVPEDDRATVHYAPPPKMTPSDTTGAAVLRVTAAENVPERASCDRENAGPIEFDEQDVRSSLSGESRCAITRRVGENLKD